MNRVFASPEEAMRRALELARRGVGLVEPNPPVGAVLVDAGLRLLGEGWHEKFGGPHAEIVALAQAGASARGATLFVTLEPCCHVGKTPPCTEALIAAGIKKCFVAMRDPFPQVAGRGIERLSIPGPWNAAAESITAGAPLAGAGVSGAGLWTPEAEQPGQPSKLWLPGQQ